MGSGSDALDVLAELVEFRGPLLAPKSQGKGGDDGLLMAGGPECACRTVEQGDVQLDGACRLRDGWRRGCHPAGAGMVVSGIGGWARGIARSDLVWFCQVRPRAVRGRGRR